MVCAICRDMLVRQKGRLCKGTLDLQFEHHTNGQDFLQSVRQNCVICRALYINLQAGSKRTTEYMLPEIDCSSLTSRAYLAVLKREQLYSLEIKLCQAQRQIRHTFHLEDRTKPPPCPNRRSAHVIYRNPEDSASWQPYPLGRPPHDVCDTAVRWLNSKCTVSRLRTFYPKRLISLEELKAWNGPPDVLCTEETAEKRIHLVETSSWYQSAHSGPGYSGGNQEYVTLSHCWGRTVNERQKLTIKNYQEFVRGIPIHRLPRTFRDAILFAARLECVGYIWIDSLCIIQGDKEDWLHQSADMYRIYSETFLNLSATSSTDSEGGLFRHSQFDMLKEEEVLVNIEGLPRAYVGRYPNARTDLADLEEENGPISDRERLFLQPCTILDDTFWTDQVDRGAVNTRGWVLQERLMSPRVMHFCQYQMGWECCGFKEGDLETMNGYPEITADHRVANRRVIERLQMKAHRPGATTDARIPLPALKLWAKIVNTYTKTAITQPQDKLIALSGLARIMATEIASSFVAGLWRTHLASQLLWYIEPIFNRADRSFSHPATFTNEYRAPSFSWAAIDVVGHGVTYANATGRNLLVRIEDVFTQTLTENKYGMVSAARITLWGKLRQVRLVSGSKNRFEWYLVDREVLDDECHRNVYLDCPQRDAESIDNQNARTYLLPVARNDVFAGTSRNEYLVCLLLRPGHEDGTFKRIGMTKLSPTTDRRAMEKSKWGATAKYEILRPYASDVSLPHDGNYDEKSGMHRISLV